MDKIPGKPEQLVHESETQRQYVRVDVPGSIRIGGLEHSIHNISTGGISILHKDCPYRTGSIIEFSLNVPFQSFAIDIPLKAEIEHYNKETGLLGCRFVDLTKEKISILTNIVRGYIAGDLVTAGEILNIASRENFARPRFAPGDGTLSPETRMKRFALFGLIGLAGLAALYVLSLNIYRSAFTVQSVRGIVESEERQIKSPETGIFQSSLKTGQTQIEEGQEIGRIVPSLLKNGETPGAALEIKSPCACHAIAHVEGGESYVEAGATLLTLIPLDAQLRISVVVEAGQAQKISIGDKASVKIAGSDIELTGTVERYEASLQDLKGGVLDAGAQRAGVTTIIITPDRKLPFDLRGRPATVIFRL